MIAFAFLVIVSLITPLLELLKTVGGRNWCLSCSYCVASAQPSDWLIMAGVKELLWNVDQSGADSLLAFAHKMILMFSFGISSSVHPSPF